MNSTTVTSTYHNHQYCGCEHELHYCKICDVAYCSKCGKEWKYQTQWYTYPYVTYQYNSLTDGNTEVTPHIHVGG